MIVTLSLGALLGYFFIERDNEKLRTANRDQKIGLEGQIDSLRTRYGYFDSLISKNYLLAVPKDNFAGLKPVTYDSLLIIEKYLQGKVRECLKNKRPQATPTGI